VLLIRIRCLNTKLKIPAGIASLAESVAILPKMLLSGPLDIP
jgi:hypothetical protein